LFLDSALLFEGAEKLAGTLTRLSDNVDTWPQEVIQEAYKQVPYLSDFEANVVLDKIDEERGFAFGSVEVRPKTAKTLEEQQMAGGVKAHIPIIVKEQLLSPLDVFMVGKQYHHLTEGKLRSALFQPDFFDATRMRPYDPSLVYDLLPPTRMGGGMGSGVKMGSAELPLLPMLHYTVKAAHSDRMREAMQDPSILAAASASPEGVKAAFLSAAGLQVSSPTKIAEALSERIRPNVVQITKLGSRRALVKWANTDMYAPQEEEMPLSTAMDMMGQEDEVQQLDADGTITLSPNPVVKKTLEAEEVDVAKSFGLWKVQDVTGNTLVGWVFPNLLSLDMSSMPLSLFTNGSQYALQGDIAGVAAGKSTDIPKGIPRGYGALYYIDHGTARCFVPMTVNNTYRGPDGLVRYMAQTDLGEHVMFSFADGLKTVVKTGTNEYAVPTTVSWLPLRGQTELVENPMGFSKVAKLTSTVELISDGATWSYRGAGVAKLASSQTKFLSRRDAEFMGASLGVERSFLKEALDSSKRTGHPVEFVGVRPITLLRDKLAEAKLQVQGDLADLPVPIHNYFLVKEATLLDDALTADKILGLGFINAENVGTFVDMLPDLERTSTKLAELLIAVRIGLKDVPEVAVERMLKALEDVIGGLRSLKQQEQVTMQ
jgi:hypothetical protein